MINFTNNIKKILFILSLILFINCDCSHQEVSDVFVQPSNISVQPEIEQITKDNIQYHIKWKPNEVFNSVDVRIVTLEKNGIKHDYVIATSYVGRGGGISIEHWEGCECKN